MRKFKLVCFDVDGTLIRGVSWRILTRRLGCPLKTHERIYRAAKEERISVPAASKMLIGIWRKGGNANKDLITKTLQSIKPRPEAKYLISFFKKKGYRVCLISGAIDIHIASIARELKVGMTRSQSSLKFDKNGELIKIVWHPRQENVKLKQLKYVVRKLKLNMRHDVVFVGDSDNDVEVFKATGHGIAVHCQSKKLKHVGKK